MLQEVNKRFNIRYASMEDAAKLAAISEDSLVYSWNERDFTEAIEYDSAKVFLCEEGEEPVGYAIIYHAADEGEIASIAVKRRMRRQGIGTLMLEHLFDEGYGLGVRKLFLEVRESNEPAIGLYESAGFLRVGVRKGFYERPKEDASVMMRILGDSRIESN